MPHTTGRTTAWVGGVVFAALMLMTTGFFNIVAGLGALIGPDDAYIDTQVGLLILDIEAWGWIHLILGISLLVIGGCLAAGQTWALVAAVILVSLNLLTQFIILPAQPWWSVIIIVIDALILWALVAHGDETKNL
jgi:hypothetical protein